MADVEGTRTFQVAAATRTTGSWVATPASWPALSPTSSESAPPPGFWTSAAVPARSRPWRSTVPAPRTCPATDPTPAFVEVCRARNPGVDVRREPPSRCPSDDGVFDCAAAQLVFHFVSDPTLAVGGDDPGGATRRSDRRVRLGLRGGMEMLRTFWDAALAIDPKAPDEARTLRFGRQGELADLLGAAGLAEVSETTLRGQFPLRHVRRVVGRLRLRASGLLVRTVPGLSPDRQAALRQTLFELLGEPTGEFTLDAVALAARAARPATNHGPGRRRSESPSTA